MTRFAIGIVIFIALIQPSPAIEIDGFGEDSQRKFGWEIVNDGVMGGLSKGTVSITDQGTLLFRGTLSLENNGGFSSIRSARVPMDLSGAEGITLRVRGDGRTYMLRLLTDARVQDRRVAFMAPFQTVAGHWTDVRVPFQDFEGSWRGERVPEAVLDPARVEGFGFQISDKKAGPFSLEVDDMRTFSK